MSNAVQPAEPGERLDRVETRMGRLEERMGGLEGRMGGLEGRIAQLTWVIGLSVSATFALIGLMWLSVTSDIGSLRADVVELQRALPAAELRLTDRINALERTLSERIHSLELAFIRAGIEFAPLAPRQPIAPEQEPAEAPRQQGMMGSGPAHGR